MRSLSSASWCSVSDLTCATSVVFSMLSTAFWVLTEILIAGTSTNPTQPGFGLTICPVSA